MGPKKAQISLTQVDVIGLGRRDGLYQIRDTVTIFGIKIPILLSDRCQAQIPQLISTINLSLRVLVL